jgi:hypothetical protein
MLSISNDEYNNPTKPYPYILQDSFLDNEFAKLLQEEILNIPENDWDRYNNPFEQKYTLRDKFHFPSQLTKLFTTFESEEFVEELSRICGYSLILDKTRNFWGVHKYKRGDRLDIHVDAGLHPTMGLKKQLTLGLYLSYNWKEEYGCNFEVWKGTNSGASDAKILECVDMIEPKFNRLILFTCNDYSWHGNPEPATCPDAAKRIFITISYMTNNFEDTNKRMKAYFVKRPGDPEDAEKDRLRLLRADPEKYKEVYRV